MTEKKLPYHIQKILKLIKNMRLKWKCAWCGKEENSLWAFLNNRINLWNLHPHLTAPNQFKKEN